MMRPIAFVSTLAMAALAACNGAGARDGEASSAGKSGQRSFAVASFDSVSHGGPHLVNVTVGPTASVRAEGDEELLNRLLVEVENGELRIRERRGNWPSLRNQRPLTIHVSTPALKAASLSGSGDIRIDRVQGESFSGSVGGSGGLQVGSLTVDRADLSIGGSGTLRAAGVTRSADLSVAGSGNIDGGALEAKTAKVEVAGSGNVHVRASETAQVSMAGSGNARVEGTARCTVSKAGSGNVQCGA